MPVLFASLGDTTRSQIVVELGQHGPASISRLSSNFKMTRQAVTKHLSTLEQVGVVSRRRRGREQLYALEPAVLLEASQWLQGIARDWDRRLAKLKSIAEAAEQSGEE